MVGRCGAQATEWVTTETSVGEVVPRAGFVALLLAGWQGGARSPLLRFRDDLEMSLRLAEPLDTALPQGWWPEVARWAASDGRTLLHVVGSDARSDLPTLLLQHGASTAARIARTGGTPLHAAVEAGYVPLAKTLLDAGAAVDARRVHGETPLFDVLSAPASARESMTELLLARGADVDARDKTGRTPLFVASWGGVEVVVRLLLGHRADPLATASTSHSTPLHEAHTPQVAALLLAAPAGHAALAMSDRFGLTPLQAALVSERQPVAEVMVQLAGAAACAPVGVLRTSCLHSAVGLNHTNFVRWLLIHGVDRSAVDENGQLPGEKALALGFEELHRLLSEDAAVMSLKSEL